MKATDATFSSNVLNNPYIGFTAPKLTLVQTNNPFPGLDFDHSILVACDSNSTIRNCLSSSSTNYTVSSNSEVTFAVYAEIKQGNFKERSWFSKNIDEPFEKFVARNFFGSSPSDYIKLMDGTIVPMSESGTQFAYSERITDATFFCATALVGIIKLVEASSIITLSTKATSGVELRSTPGKTTTVLGRYGSDTSKVLEELQIPKSLDFSGNKGGFNLLNTPNELYQNPSQFWQEYNKPFIDAAIERGDRFLMATPCTPKNLYIKGTKELTGYGKEYFYLQKRGYKLVNNEMIKVVK